MDVSTILIDIIKTLPYLVLLVFPFKHRLRYSPRITIAVGAVCALVSCTLVEVLKQYSSRPGQIKILLSALSIVFLSVLCRRMINISANSLLFLIFMCKNYTDIILLSGICAASLFRMETTGVSCAVMSVAVMVLTLPLCYLLVKHFLLSVLDCSEYLPFWKYLWILPGFYYAVYRLAIYPQSYRPGEEALIPGWQLAVFWIAMVVNSYFFLFRVMIEILEGVRAKEKLHSAQLLSQIQKEQYLALQNSIEESRRNRHDLKQQLIVIRGYLNQGDNASALDYIAQCIQLYSCHVEEFCRNYAVNSILSYYVGMARANKIETAVSVDLPDTFDVPEVDFCTLLGNLLLNAVEAGIRKKSGKRNLIFRMAPAGSDMLVLTVSNTYEGELRIRDGVFYSSKRDGEGIGTVSIRQIVKKYGGILKYTYENGIFEASVLMRLSPPGAAGQDGEDAL